MAKFRPTADASAPGWTSTAGTLAAAINEAVADDASYITSPALAATVDPYRFAIGPIAAGTLTKTIRAQRTGSVGDLRLVFLDAGGVEVGASEWQAVTPDWAAYTLEVVTTGTATQGEIQVRGEAAYSPLSLFENGEQGAWYDPSDLSTLFQDAAGTTPVTAVGQPVGRMLDKSGNGNHATQSTTSRRPILQIDGGGRHYLLFDGVDDGMATASVNFTATDKISFTAGFHRATHNLGVLVELSANFNGVNGFAVFTPDNFSLLSFAISGVANTYSAAFIATGITTPVTEVFSASADRGLTVDEVYGFRRNGAGSAVTRGINSNPTGNFMSAALYIGRRGGTSLPFSGRIYQLIIRGALTDATGITAAETFVNSKTGAY